MTAIDRRGAGTERKVDPFGRIVIPSAYREWLGIAPGDVVEIDVVDGAIVLRPKRQARRSSMYGMIERTNATAAFSGRLPNASWNAGIAAPAIPAAYSRANWILP